MGHSCSERTPGKGVLIVDGPTGFVEHWQGHTGSSEVADKYALAWWTGICEDGASKQDP
jgi:hypothetical protein